MKAQWSALRLLIAATLVLTLTRSSMAQWSHIEGDPWPDDAVEVSVAKKLQSPVDTIVELTLDKPRNGMPAIDTSRGK